MDIQESLLNAAGAARDFARANHLAFEPAWVDVAYDALIIYLLNHSEFFVDDFWAANPDLPQPIDKRALGAVVTKASREGHMMKSGRSRPSVRSNLSDKPIWTSLIRRTN